MKLHITNFIHLTPFCFKQDPKKLKNNQKGLQSFFIHLIDLASHTQKKGFNILPSTTNTCEF